MTAKPGSTGNQNVIVGYLHGDYWTQEFGHSLFRLYTRDIWQSRRILDFAPEYSGANLCRARNQIVKLFLERDNAEWLLMLDIDAAFSADTLDRLLAVADPDTAPVVGALAYQKRGKLADGEPVFDPLGNQIVEIKPTMYRIDMDGDTYVGYREIETWNRGLHPVDATGAHCLLVHRTVFEAIKSDHPYRWFREDQWGPGGPIVGEDIWFCLAAREAGFPIHVDTRIEAGHVKRFMITSVMDDRKEI